MPENIVTQGNKSDQFSESVYNSDDGIMTIWCERKTRDKVQRNTQKSCVEWPEGCSRPLFIMLSSLMQLKNKDIS
jgi:hypothetical protein